jgi:ribosomal-protein-serine acetyltransferase
MEFTYMYGVEKPILLDFPDSFETERLLIRAPRAGDGQAMNAALAESIDNLKHWLPMAWTQNIQTVDETEEMVRRWAAAWMLREDLRLSLFRKTDGLYVGGSGLHRIDWNVMRFEIGYWVRSSLEGQGYIREAVAGVTAYAFDVIGAERIEIRCDRLNERSIAVARRAGYVMEGILRNNYDTPAKSALRDMMIFSILRAEYLQHKQITEMEK